MASYMVHMYSIRRPIYVIGQATCLGYMPVDPQARDGLAKATVQRHLHSLLEVFGVVDSAALTAALINDCPDIIQDQEFAPYRLTDPPNGENKKLGKNYLNYYPSPEDYDAVALVAEGRTYSEIGNIFEKSRGYSYRLLSKLRYYHQAANNAALVAMCLRDGLIQYENLDFVPREGCGRTKVGFAEAFHLYHPEPESGKITHHGESTTRRPDGHSPWLLSRSRRNTGNYPAPTVPRTPPSGYHANHRGSTGS